MQQSNVRQLLEVQDLPRKTSIPKRFYHFCFIFPVIMAKLMARDVAREAVAPPGWTRWSLNVQAVYKRGPRSRLHRGTVPMFVRGKDLACKCPKLKINK